MNKLDGKSLDIVSEIVVARQLLAKVLVKIRNKDHFQHKR
jgi:hypothetical protein